jgi:hypothetical protein
MSLFTGPRAPVYTPHSWRRCRDALLDFDEEGTRNRLGGDYYNIPLSVSAAVVGRRDDCPLSRYLLQLHADETYIARSCRRSREI